MRKLIDIPQDVFDILNDKAKQNGMNLKNYIERLLCKDAGTSEKPSFNFTMDREPSDKELRQIMQEASELAAERARLAEDSYFQEIKKKMAYDFKK